MKKKLLSALLAAAMAFALCACGGSDAPAPAPEEPKQPADLTGEWKQTNSESEDSWQSATITADTIEVYWVTENGENSALYWAGTYTAPTTADEPYSWDSVNDKEKTDMALMASGDDTKTFTYENGEISYSVSAFGVTTTVKLGKN